MLNILHKKLDVYQMGTQFEIAIILEYYKNGQMQELEQYLESTFRMLNKMIDNPGKTPLTASH
jgi:hypothetical protein